MEKFNIESSLAYSELSPNVVEEKILKRFNYLNDNKNIHNYFSSYDFRPEEGNMVKIWEEILKFLFLDIFSTFGMKISEIKKYTVVRNYAPLCLNNIIQDLRANKKLITDADILNQEFYNKNFPELYSDESSSQGWGSYLFSGVKKIVNFGAVNLGCKEDEGGEKIEKRNDLLDDDKYKELPDNTVIFNYELLKNNCNQLLEFLSNILQENDNEIISKNEFIKEVNNVSANNAGGMYNGINLHFGSIYIEHCLIYLMKLKKISIFSVEENNQKIDFIKLMITKNDTPNEKDTVTARILLKNDSLQTKISELDKKIELCTNNAKAFIKKGDKNGAKPWLARKKKFEKFKQIYENTHITLIQQMLDIKNAESNVKITEILKSCNNLFKKIGVDKDDFNEVSEDLKEQKDFQNEITNNLKEFVGDNDEELDEELKDLEKENQKEENLEFPSALNQPINPFSAEDQELYNQK